MSVESLLKYTKIDKVQTIQDLLEKISELESDVRLAEEAIKVNGQIAIDTINREKKNANEVLEAYMEKYAEALESIKRMDEVAADSNIFVRCKKCGEMYDLPVNLSEFDPEFSYCGKGGPSPCLP